MKTCTPPRWAKIFKIRKNYLNKSYGLGREKKSCFHKENDVNNFIDPDYERVDDWVF